MMRREIGILLQIAARVDDESPREFGTEADLALLAEKGLIENPTGVVTEKGEAYIRALEATPMPVQQWVVPAPPNVFSCRIDDAREDEPEQPAKRSKKRGNRT